MKGVILAAGYGTRFLPVTRCVPKEMLPIIDRPALDYVVTEFIEAGITEILLVSSRRKPLLAQWFERDEELDSALSGKSEAVRKQLDPPKVSVQEVFQEQMLGTGQALMLAKDFAGSDPVVVAYPDDLFGQPNCTAQLIQSWQKTGCSTLGAMRMPQHLLSRYGVLDVTEEEGRLRVHGFVEKPDPADAPSDWVSVGRYLVTAEIFERLEAGFQSHQGGEYYHVDALNGLAQAGRLIAQPIEGTRYDTGTPLGWLKTVVDQGLRQADIEKDLRAWLKTRL